MSRFWKQSRMGLKCVPEGARGEDLHQPPTSLIVPAEPQRLYPHCLSCSGKQGWAILRLRVGDRK